MELLRELASNTLANALWVVLAIAWLGIRDRRRRAQEARCLEAGLAALARSAPIVRTLVHAYAHLVRSAASAGTILVTMLDHLALQVGSLAAQIPQLLVLTSSPTLARALLELHEEVLRLRGHVAESRMAADIVVGNPDELVSPPRGPAEIERYDTAARGYLAALRRVLDAAAADRSLVLDRALWSELDRASPLEPRTPSVAPAWRAALVAGRAQIAAGKFAAAVECLEDARRDAADAPELLGELGIARKLGGDPASALPLLERSVAGLASCDSAAAQRVGVVLALTLDDLGRRADALGAFERVESLDARAPAADLARHYLAAYRGGAGPREATPPSSPTC